MTDLAALVYLVVQKLEYLRAFEAPTRIVQALRASRELSRDMSADTLSTYFSDYFLVIVQVATGKEDIACESIGAYLLPNAGCKIIVSTR